MMKTETSEFTRFIGSMLTIAGISPTYQQAFLKSENMDLFRKAFTHPSVNSQNNYETLEFIGDGILKGILSIYIPQRFPEFTTNEGKLSKIRRSLEQRKTLAEFGLALGFWEHVDGDNDVMSTKRTQTLEDVYEAFIGALTLTIDRCVKRGVGFKYAQQFVEYSLKRHTIDLSEETLDDPVSRLNELYVKGELKRGHPLKWGFPKYHNITIFIDNVDDKIPPSHSVPRGTMVFSKKYKTVFVNTASGFIPFSKVKYPINILVPNYTYDMLDTRDITKVRLSMVFAKPEPFVLSYLKTKGVQPIFDPQKGVVIGQAVALQQKDGKKIAAQQAVQAFKDMGYER